MQTARPCHTATQKATASRVCHIGVLLLRALAGIVEVICRELAAQFPSVSHWMAGRGLVYNPALGRQLQGGEPLTPEELRAFHDQLVEAYRQVLSGDRPVLGKMKELWFYWSRHFLQPEGPLKRIRKAKTLLEYRDGVNALFRDCPFQEEGPVTF